MANQTAIIGGIVVVIIVIAAIVLYSGNGSAVTYQTTTVQPTPTTTVMPTGSNGTAGGNANGTSTKGTGKTNSTTTKGTNSTSVTSVTETFNIVENEFSITPSAITVLSGDRIVFNVTNAGHQTHNIMFVSGITGGIPSLRAGQVQLFTFTAPAPGVYTYQSNFGADTGYNMSGTLTVK
ncbi:MAG: cupredoxin domain-containing protein [Candidatus Micrarchaeota archaeon]|nr:cupredoxin domain-containing protein [Candidatus Micrarchaeota archaeon]